jgi:hypothetical protein
MFGELQSSAIFWQQSISECVVVWSGMKQASCGAMAQLSRLKKTNALNDDDTRKVYNSAS